MFKTLLNLVQDRRYGASVPKKPVNAATATSPAADLDRKQQILEAAAELVSEGGYAALSIRALAGRAEMSLGLLYYYFTDKHDVFEALMQEHQRRMTEFLDAFPREKGLEALLHEVMPVAERQWRVVGRMVAVWRAESSKDSAQVRRQRRRVAARQFEALGRALEECAAAEGAAVRDEPEIVPFVWSALMGLADLRTHGWTSRIDQQRLTGLTLDAIRREVLVAPDF